MTKKFFLILFLFTALFLPDREIFASSARAEIFYNEACADCAVFVKNVLPKILKEYGIFDIAYRDYINEPQNREILRKKNSAWGVPYDLQSHIETFVDDKILLAGHIPPHAVRTLLAPENQKKFDKILVYQDEMHGSPKFYRAWDFQGEVKQFAINEKIDSWLDSLALSPKVEKSLGRPLLWLVIVSGFLNGLHPCAFAVLLFFLSFLFTLRRVRTHILGMGLMYILGIYLTYFLIGMGALKSIMLSDSPFFIGKVAGMLVIILGAINLLGVFFPRFPIRLKIPASAHGAMKKYMEKASLPAAFLVGVLVGLCAFPCSGGIYVAVLGLLGAKVTFFTGVGYLALYNLMFIILLLAVLLLAANKKTLDKIADFEAGNSRWKRIAASLFMIILGAGILIWIF